MRRVTISSLDVLLLLFGTSPLYHVQFELLLPDLHTGFSRDRLSGLVSPSFSENSTVYCDPHSQRFGLVNMFFFSDFHTFPFWSFSKNIADQESGFLVSVAFFPSVSRMTTPVCNISCQKESILIRNWLRSHMIN